MQMTKSTAEARPFLTHRKLGWFLVAPITTLVLFVLLLAFTWTSYQQSHADRVFTGVTVWDVDLSHMTLPEAQRALLSAFPYLNEQHIMLIDAKSGDEWARSPSELGLSLDAAATVDVAYGIGRQGGPLTRLREQFEAWYYGRALSPIVVFDEGQLDRAIAALAAEIDRPAADANLIFDGTNVGFGSSQLGRTLDQADARSRLLTPIGNLRQVQLELLVHETRPRIQDTSQAAQEIQQIMSGPMVLYLQEPLDGVDLERITIPVDELVHWIRIRTEEDAQGLTVSQVFLDENAIRAWLVPYEPILQREPVNARFYFDDSTEELVLVEPHLNGQVLDVDATVARLIEQVVTPNRSMPIILKDVVPVAHSGATTADLSITELVSESTTWFFGSSNERKHNIARAAANFYGIVIAPGQEFSFNHFLGDVSEEQGYETGLIIFGGRTIEGVGGGVCQVSTTVFQAAFWAGYPIVERWEHGYRVGYYDDGEGPGMDATVYSPLVDFRFINDTPHHLLIENYYSEANSSLTFKFYSTSMGRTVVKEGPEIRNVVPPKPDIWELNDELATGEIEQVDWAVEGADVTVVRRVYNSFGDLLREDTFVSRYIPWQNIYQYGPGTAIPTPEGQAPAEEQTPPAETPAAETPPAE
jgi:vancomycin resistance protein YoaR